MRAGSGQGAGRLNRAKSCRLGAWVIAFCLGVGLASASPASAQNADARGAIVNLFGSLIQGAVADNVRTSWLKVDPEILYCLGIVHHISPAQLAAQGVSPTDARLQPYIRDCQVRIANVPPENRERLADEPEQFAAEQAAEIQGQRQQAGQALAGQTIQGGVQAYRQAQQERAAEDQARRAQQQQAAWDAQQRQQAFAAQEQQRQAQLAAQQRLEWEARQRQQAALTAQQAQAASQRGRPGFQQIAPAQTVTPAPSTTTPPNTSGRFSFRPTATGTVEVYQDGRRVSTTTPQYAAQLGYVPTAIPTSRPPASIPSPQSSPSPSAMSTAPGISPPSQSSRVPAPPTANTVVTRDTYTFVQNYDGDAVGTVSIYKNGQLVQTAVPQTAAAYGYRGGELDSYQTSDGSAARNVASTETSRASISTMPTTTAGLASVTVSSSAGVSSGAAYAASRPPNPPAQTGPIYPGAPGSPTYNAALANPSYTFRQTSSGTIETYKNGQLVATGSPEYAAQFGYVPGANSGGQPSSSSPPQTPTPAGQQTYVTPNGAVVTATGQVVRPAGSVLPNQPATETASLPHIQPAPAASAPPVPTATGSNRPAYPPLSTALSGGPATPAIPSTAIAQSTPRTCVPLPQCANFSPEALSALDKVVKIASDCSRANCIGEVVDVASKVALGKILVSAKIVPPMAQESKQYQFAVQGGTLLITVAGVATATALGASAAVPITTAGGVVFVTALLFRPTPVY